MQNQLKSLQKKTFLLSNRFYTGLMQLNGTLCPEGLSQDTVASLTTMIWCGAQEVEEIDSDGASVDILALVTARGL